MVVHSDSSFFSPPISAGGSLPPLPLLPFCFPYPVFVFLPLQVCASLEAVRAYAASSPLAAAETVPFWRQAQISFGNSALLLSGGAMMGIYHYGVVRALIERGALPRVISGTSAGSVVAAFLAVRTDEEIIFELRSLDNLYREQGSDGPLHGSHWWKLKKLLTTGVLYSLDEFKAHLCWFTRGLTFREAFLVTGRVISITCTPHKRMSASSPPLSARRARGRDTGWARGPRAVS